MTKVIRETTANIVTAKMAKPTAPAGTETPNRAGGPAYVADQRDSVLSYLMTGGTGASYYTDAKEHENVADALFAKASEADPEYLARAIVYARQQGFMRSMPIRALAHLSSSRETQAKRLFQQIFKKTIQTPGDLADFVSLTRGESRVRGNSRGVRTAVGGWLDTISPYHVIKYGSESQKMSLRDIYRLAHPTLTTPESQAIARYVVRSEILPELPSQLQGYDAFKKAHDTIPNLLSMVAEHRLPWEVVSGQLSGGDASEKKLVWTAMSEQMPYMALLRNLRNLANNGVLDDKAARTRVLDTIRNPERVRTSKQFPFRFLSAIRAIQQNSELGAHRDEVISALKDALEISVSNMPNLGRTLISLDVSGSMGTQLSGQGNTRNTDPISAVDVGAIFAGALYRASEVATVYTFDTQVRDETPGLSKSMSLLEIQQRINHHGGGTSLHAPIQKALTRGESYDTLVFITDSESWAGEVMSGGNSWSGGAKNRTSLLLTEYLSRNPQAQVFFLQLVPSYTRMTTPDMPGVFYTYGWNDNVMRYIAYQHGGATQTQAVMDLDIS